MSLLKPNQDLPPISPDRASDLIQSLPAIRRDVLGMMTLGFPIVEIAGSIGYAAGTVKGYTAGIYKSLGLEGSKDVLRDGARQIAWKGKLLEHALADDEVELPATRTSLERRGLGQKDTSLMSEFELGLTEYEILRLAARGIDRFEIADRLFLSPSTIPSHKNRLLQRIGGDKQRVLEKFAA